MNKNEWILDVIESSTKLDKNKKICTKKEGKEEEFDEGKNKHTGELK